MNFRVRKNAGSFMTSWGTVSVSRRTALELYKLFPEFSGHRGYNDIYLGSQENSYLCEKVAFITALKRNIRPS